MAQYKIKDIPESDRPREKLVKNGTKRLKDEDLLAILFRSGYKGKNVIELSKYLLKKYSLKKLLRLTYKDLINLKGIGPAKAATIKAAFELCRRALSINDKSKVKIDNAKDAFAQVTDLCNKKQEHLVALYLNARNELLARETITVGILTANLISPREIFSKALDNLAISIVLVHNHPSGDETPSSEDLSITEKLIKAGKIMDVSIFDHLIVSKNGYTSLRQKAPAIFKEE